MSKQWNQMSSVNTEPIKEIMSKELSKRVKIEDFVWVDLPETIEVVGISGSAPTVVNTETENQSPSDTCSGNVAKVVQSVSQSASSEEKAQVSDQEHYDNNLVPENEQMFQTEYVNQSLKHKDKPSNLPKIKYPKPFWLNIRERGNYSIDKRQISKKDINNLHSKEKIDELLPNMKFDISTTAVLKMLIDNRYLGQYNDLVGTGKNSFVFHACCNRRNCITMPLNNAVKIYKINKYEDRNNIIYKKVQREFEHMSIASRSLPCLNHVPSPVRAWKNVIVMGFVGFNDQVALSIENVPFEKIQKMYDNIIDLMHKFYYRSNLVHGKLSTRNILFWLEKPCFIGWSHSVKREHPQALTKLMKDCQFVTKFYERRGVSVKSAIDLFREISMQETISDKFLKIIKSKDLYDKNDVNPNRRSMSPIKPTTNNRFK